MSKTPSDAITDTQPVNAPEHPQPDTSDAHGATGADIRMFSIYTLHSVRTYPRRDHSQHGDKYAGQASDWMLRQQVKFNRYGTRAITLYDDPVNRQLRHMERIKSRCRAFHKLALWFDVWDATHSKDPLPQLPAVAASAHTKPRLLDLFCGGGGAGMGYHRTGFDVTGVDINPQPNYPFAFIQADALQYVAEHGHEYDVIHASPPCQKYSLTRNMSKKPDSDYADLVAPTRDALIATGKPYVIENVVNAPVQGIKLNGVMFPDRLRVIRDRLFESNILLLQPARGKKRGHTSGRGKGYSSFDDGYYITVAGHNFRFRDGCVAMEIDWMTQQELAESIPPAYTEYIGRQLMRHLKNTGLIWLPAPGNDLPQPDNYYPVRIAS